MTQSSYDRNATGLSRLRPVIRPKSGNRRVIPIPSDAASAEEDARLRAKFAGTTPHGREIIRRRLHALKKELLAKR